MEVILLRTVLLTIGDDGHQYIVLFAGLGIELGNGDADGIIKRRASSRIVVAGRERVDVIGLDIVVFEGLVTAVEGEQRYALLHIGMELLHLLHGFDGLVDTGKSLTLYHTHRTTLVHDNHIEYSFHLSLCFWRLNICCVFHLRRRLSIKRKTTGKNEAEQEEK